MTVISAILVGLVAVLQFYFMIFEMFFWTKPQGLRTFRQTLEAAEASKVLAANQGLYNGFLSAGLIWGLLEPTEQARSIKIFFLSCVLVAALYGAKTVSRKIFFVQGLPATLALVTVFLIS